MKANRQTKTQRRSGRLRASEDIARDITERKRAEEALRENETRYRLISRVTSDYMFSTRLDADGKLALNWVAGAFERITGYTFEEYVAHGGWRAALHPDDLTMDDRQGCSVLSYCYLEPLRGPGSHSCFNEILRAL